MRPTTSGEDVVEGLRDGRFWIGGARMGRSTMPDGSPRSEYVASLWRSAVDGTDLPIVKARDF
jgi:hypothetical protein